MPFCRQCGSETKSTDKFCAECGTPLSPGTPAGAVPRVPDGSLKTAKGKPVRPALILTGMILPAAAGLAIFFLGSEGCSSVEGGLVAGGGTIPAFRLDPTQCRSGARRNFFGVILVGKDQHQGGLIVSDDVTRGKFLRVEVPGSCEPPDYEKCNVIDLSASDCSRFKVNVRTTNSTVNDIRLLEGELDIECETASLGKISGGIKFESCD